MATKEKNHQIKTTLPLIALCLPLFAQHYVKAENNCPYETYLRLDNKCLDISQQGLNEIAEELNQDVVKKVSKEIKEVSQELEDLSNELDEFCTEELPETDTQVEIMEDVCQY